MKTKATLFLIVLVALGQFASQFGWTIPEQSTVVVRVCAYENAPKIYMDENDGAAGFWPDLLGAIAQEEGWTLVWKDGTWEQCLAWLKENQVDVVPDTGWTEARSQTYAFSGETVLTSWTRLYVPTDSQIKSILDLHDKTIAGLRGSVNMDGPEGIKDLVSKFGLHATFVEMESYTQVFEALEQGTVDAGITNKDFGNRNEANYRVVRTPIIFQPARLHFAFSKDAPLTPYLIERMDAHLLAYQADSNSVYYRALDQYLGAGDPETVNHALPGWMRSVALWLGGVTIFLLAVSIVSQLQVRRRTADLDQSQSLLQSVIASTPDAIFAKDTDGKYILCNEGTAQVMGRPIVQILGQDDHTLFPDDADRIVATDQEIIAGGKVITFEESVANPAGERRTFLTTKGPLFDNDDQVLGLFGMARDITERKDAQKALFISEERFRKAFFTSSDSININRLEDGLFVEINPGFTQVTGYSEAEVIGKTSSQINIWADPQDRDRLVAGLRQNGEVRNLEAQFRKKDGSLATGLMSATVIELDNVLHIISITRDITERTQAEMALRESEQRYHTLTRISPVGIFRTDIAGMTTYVNEAWCTISGLSAEAAMDDGWLAAVHPDDRQALHRGWQKATSQVKASKQEYRFLHADGTVAWVMGQAIQEVDANGQVVGYVGTITDITERKLAEAQLIKSEMRFKRLFDNASIGIIICDLIRDNEGKIVDYVHVQANRGLEIHAGLAEADVVGKRCSEVIPPEETAPFIAMLTQVLETGTPYSYEQHFPSLGRTIEHRPFLIERDLFALTFFDITERKESELVIRQRVQELDILNNLGRDVSLSLSLDEVISAGLRGVQKAFDSDVAIFFLQEGGKLVLKRRLPAQASARLEDGSAVCPGKTLCTTAFAQKKPLYASNIFDHEPDVWQECNRAGIRSFAALPLINGGEVIGVIGLGFKEVRDLEVQAGFMETVRTTIAASLGNALLYEETQERFKDLTAIHHTAQQLQALQTPEALSRTVIQLLEDELAYERGAILLVGADGETLIPFAGSDQGAKDDFAAPDKADLANGGMRVGKGIAGWVAQTGQSVRSGDVTQDPRYADTRPEIRSELCVPLRSGQQILGVINTKTPRPNAYSEADQRVLETIASQVVIALQNARLLEQVQAQADELERRVMARTIQLQAANKSLETFSYSVSHDLRAPLRAINGFAAIVARRHRDTLNEEGQHYVDNIVQASVRMGQLIDDLLTYSRLGRMGVRQDSVSLAAILGDICEELQSYLGENGGILKVAEGLPWVLGDESLLRQIFTNLLDNAVKYHRPTEPPLVVVDFRVEKATVVVSVSDNGIGISAEYQEMIFAIFQRLHGENDYPGTGIGLASVKKAVELLNGQIWVDSQDGRGSTFFVRLPKGKNPV